MGPLGRWFMFLCFTINATPRWLLVIVAAFSAFATIHIGARLSTLPIDLVLALPRGMWSGDPWAWASVVLLADIGAMFYFYRRLWIACEVRLARRK